MVDIHRTGAFRSRLQDAGAARVEAPLQSVLDAISDPVAILDKAGDAVLVNAAWRRAGAGEELLGCRLGDNYLDACRPDADDADAVVLQEGVRRVLSGVRSKFEGVCRIGPRPDAPEHRVMAHRIMGAGPARALVMHRPATAPHAPEQAEEGILAARLDERQRLAMDLHDSLGQTLVCIGLGLTRLRRLAPEDPEIGLAVSEMSESVRQAQLEIRTLSYLLNPPWLEESAAFEKVVRDFVEGFGRRAGLQATVELAAAPLALSRPRQLMVFRILQEALVNVHRHARADCVAVRLTRNGRKLVLAIEDNGEGIGGPEGRVPSRGVGLTSMRSRARQLGGDLRIVSGPGGTTVIATFPIDADGPRTVRGGGPPSFGADREPLCM
jgi:signal transduction histidine kinase